jgi:hypothetical protein
MFNKSTGKLNITPPSITRLAPVINCASIEDKNTIPFAISKGSPSLPKGVAFTSISTIFFASSSLIGTPVELPILVSISPGLYRIQRIGY